MANRSASQPVQTPGATQQPQGDDDQAEVGQDAAQPTDMAEVIAALQAKVQALESAAAATEAAKLPQVVYEPETPHGAARLATSPTAHMTVAEVRQAIDDKRMPEPSTNYLCRDGYYCRRPRSE